MRRAFATGVSSGGRRFWLFVLEGSIAVRTNTSRLAAGTANKAGVTNRTVAAQMRDDRKIINGAKHGCVLRHLTLELPHVRMPLSFMQARVASFAFLWIPSVSR